MHIGREPGEEIVTIDQGRHGSMTDEVRTLLNQFNAGIKTTMDSMSEAHVRNQVEHRRELAKLNESITKLQASFDRHWRAED